MALKCSDSRGAWVAQLVKHPTLDFSSRYDLMVHGIEPCVRFRADSKEAAWDSLSPSLSLSLSAPPLLEHTLSLSLSQNK